MAGKFSDLDDRCKKAVEHFKKDLSRLRGGRASTSLLEGLTVDYYGSQVPLMQLGMINAPEPRQLTVQVYDSGAIDAIEKAIQASELGLNPQREGTLLRINIPALTEERRKDLIRRTHKMAEETRVGVRNHRREAMDQLKRLEKDKKISADEAKRDQEEVQKITDRYVANVDETLKGKEKELMEV